jgi:predicted anti-sigma-YlaC factor YlaD
MLTPVPPTDCMLARESASVRLDGELPELDALRLDAHLATCADCAAFAASIAGATGTLRGAPLEPLPAAALFTPRRRRRRPHLVAVAAASLVVAAAAGSSFLLGQQLGGRGGSTAPPVRAAVTAAPAFDPGLLAMLRGERGWLNQNRRAIAL